MEVITNLYIAVAHIYCVSIIMVTITRLIFIKIFQTEPFSAVKFAMGKEKKYDLSCDTKISKSLTKIEKIGLGSFNEL